MLGTFYWEYKGVMVDPWEVKYNYGMLFGSAMNNTDIIIIT